MTGPPPGGATLPFRQRGRGTLRRALRRRWWAGLSEVL